MLATFEAYGNVLMWVFVGMVLFVVGSIWGAKAMSAYIRKHEPGAERRRYKFGAFVFLLGVALIAAISILTWPG